MRASGHFSASADNGARMGFSAGICGAVLKLSATGTAGVGKNGIVPTGAGDGAEKAGLAGAGGAVAAVRANGIGATGEGWGVVAMVLGAGAGGWVTSFGTTGAGTGWDALGGKVGAAFAGARFEVKLTLCPFVPKGPSTSSVTSTFFAARRDNKVGLIRVMISLSGSAI